MVRSFSLGKRQSDGLSSTCRASLQVRPQFDAIGLIPLESYAKFRKITTYELKMLKKKPSSEAVSCVRPGMGCSCSEDGRHRIFTASEKDRPFGLVCRNAELNRVDFSNANLREAEFLRVSLVAADFSGADLRCAGFIGCDLREARFYGALFQFTRFDQSWLIGAHGLSEPMRKCLRQQGARLWAS
jgi:pentapeptide repeat protein